MKTLALINVAALLCCSLATNANAQSANARVSGTVADATGALIPGVTVTAANERTGVATATFTNETGAYNLPALQPGVYTVRAELSGFETRSYTGVELGTSAQVRLNFALEVGGLAQTVEVVASDSLLVSTSASVGSVLPEATVRDLPSVGRDALNLVNVLGGVQQGTGGPGGDGQFGTARSSATFAGIYAGAGAVNTTRDGISVNDNRYQLGVNSATRISPDLVGELRVIVAPVDAETGGGVGQVQVQTRSGTNEYRGSAVWSVMNSALNANTWNENRLGIEPTWFNRQQGTISFGGPIARNRTFFFALVDVQRMNSREDVTVTVLTEQARQGQFRFFPGVVNGNAESNTTGGLNPTAPVVDIAGNPVRPGAATGDLETIGVFQFDPLRTDFDSTGFVQRLLADMPLPNDYRGGDGLNTAVHRWVRPGDTLIGAQFGTEDDNNRNQFNLKIDHHFDGNHKLAVNYTQERLWNTAWLSDWPTGWNAESNRWPRVLTASFVSTLSPNVLNEFRFGWRRMKNDTSHSCDREDIRDEVLAWLPSVDGYPLRVGGGVFGGNHRINAGCNTVAIDSPTYTVADSLSWTRGRHAFKGGVELRYSSSDALSSVNWYPAANLGAGNAPVSGIETADIPGLIGGNLTLARNLLVSLAGSVASVNQAFRLDSPTAASFVDVVEFGKRPPSQNIVQNEYSAFFKDDWNVRPSLTLNLGVRYDFHGVPHEANGLMGTLGGGGPAAFGWTGQGWDDYWNFGPQRGDLATLLFVGENSPNPDARLWKNDWNNVAPSVGFSWSVPWFGQGLTTVRGGYGVSFLGHVGRAADLALWTGTVIPGASDNQTFTSTEPLFLSNVSLPVERNEPMQPISMTNRTQSITVMDDNVVSPYIQTFTLAVTRQLARTATLDVRYIGTKATKLFGAIPLNQSNFLTNGLLEALRVTREGGNADLFDQMLMGLNLGNGVVGEDLTGSEALRRSNAFRGNIANGNFTGVANTLNQSTVATGETGGLVRNGGFPENFIRNNPEFNNVTLFSNPGSSIYHSLEAQVTLRPTSGLSYQGSYTWSKAISACENAGCTSWTHPLDRTLSRGLQGSDRRHNLRVSGGYELPLGPGRALFGASRGVLARVVEGWQLSWIFTAGSGTPSTIGNTNTFVGGNRPDIVGEFGKDLGAAHMTGGLPRFFEEGRFQIVSDPQCDRVTPLGGTQGACSLRAVADSAGNILLQHAEPGTLGNLGRNWLTGPARWGLDMSVGKTVQIDETRSVQVRVDANNVLNKPILGDPDLNMNSANFGQISANNVGGARRFQAQVRFSF